MADTPQAIKKIKLSDGLEHEINAAKAEALASTSVGASDTPVYIGADGKPTACSFKISSGTLANRPTTGTNGQIYFVI